MCWLLCHLYSTRKNDEAIHHCQRLVANFQPILLLQVHRTFCIFLNLCAPHCCLN